MFEPWKRSINGWLLARGRRPWFPGLDPHYSERWFGPVDRDWCILCPSHFHERGAYDPLAAEQYWAEHWAGRHGQGGWFPAGSFPGYPQCTIRQGRARAGVGENE